MCFDLSHDATDGREKDGSRSLKTSHLGHDYDDDYISLTSSHIVRRGLNGASPTLYWNLVAWALFI